MTARRALRAASLGLASGLWSSFDPKSPRFKAVDRPARAVLGAVAGWGIHRAVDEARPVKYPGVHFLACAAGSTALLLASAGLDRAVDGRIESFLRSRGAENPRRIIALGSGVLGAVLGWFDAPEGSAAGEMTTAQRPSA